MAEWRTVEAVGPDTVMLGFGHQRGEQLGLKLSRFSIAVLSSACGSRSRKPISARALFRGFKLYLYTQYRQLEIHHNPPAVERAQLSHRLDVSSSHLFHALALLLRNDLCQQPDPHGGCDEAKSELRVIASLHMQ